jgi:hypothetical protein
MVVVVVVADLSVVALRICSWIRVIGMFGNETILDGSTFDDGNNGLDDADVDDADVDDDDDDDDDGTVDVDVDVSDVNERIECEVVKKKTNRRDQEEDCGWELSPCDGSRGRDDGNNGVKGVLRKGGVAVVVGDADADDLTTAAIVRTRPNRIMEPYY